MLCGIGRGGFLMVIPNEPHCEINACKSNHRVMTGISAEI